MATPPNKSTISIDNVDLVDDADLSRAGLAGTYIPNDATLTYYSSAMHKVVEDFEDYLLSKTCRTVLFSQSRCLLAMSRTDLEAILFQFRADLVQAHKDDVRSQLSDALKVAKQAVQKKKAAKKKVAKKAAKKVVKKTSSKRK